MDYYINLLGTSSLMDKNGTKYIPILRSEVLNRLGISNGTSACKKDRAVLEALPENASCILEKVFATGSVYGKGDCPKELKKVVSEDTIINFINTVRSIKGTLFNDDSCRAKCIMILHERPNRDEFDFESALTNLILELKKVYLNREYSDMNTVLNLIWPIETSRWEAPALITPDIMDMRKTLNNRLDIFYKMGYTIGKEIVDTDSGNEVSMFCNWLRDTADTVEKEYIASQQAKFKRS